MRAEELRVVLAGATEAVDALNSDPSARRFFRDLLTFVRDIAPLMAELQRSIELTTEKLPTASRQLDKVTAANEMASTEILDIVERIVNGVEGLQQWFRARRSHQADVTAMASALHVVARRCPGNPEVLGLVAAWERLHTSLDPLADEAAQRRLLEMIKADCTSIMIALQVQDITAQQIAGVNRLMQSMDEGLNARLRSVRGEEGGITETKEERRQGVFAFDPSAEYDTSSTRQETADFIVDSVKQQEPASRQVKVDKPNRLA
jgi:chemotaxis regulatin CheY-phosphate phosphatase CheZ